ncbi:MAG: BMP family protein [Armatimonadetes bacterium]|nr:BMP family protein [Armatimonadota bacterium]
MNKLLALMGIGFALVASGCSGGREAAQGNSSESGQQNSPASKEFKVALITPGRVSDAGWNAMAYEGLKAIESELGAKVANAEATGSKIEDAMRTYGQDGYTLVFGHGYEYNEPGVKYAGQFPNTVYISSSGGKTSKNAGTFRFYLEQGFYLAGMMAGKMSKTGKVAMIGINVPSIMSTFKGFEAGAKAARPDIDVKTVIITDPKDVVAVKQATLQAIDAGADFIIHQANEGAQAVFGACKEKGVHAIGSNADQNDDSSGAVVASAVIIAKPAFVEVAREVKEGKYQGGVRLVGMDKGAIDFVVSPKFKDQIPADLISAIEEAKKKIVSGELVVPKDEF